MSVRRLVSLIALTLTSVTTSVVVAAPAATAEPFVACFEGDSMALRNRSSWNFVTAELGYTGDEFTMLRARATSAGPWERWTLCRLTRTSKWYFLVNQAMDADQWYEGVVWADVNAPGAMDGMLRANGFYTTDGISTAEQFEKVMVGNYLTLKSRTTGKFVIAETGYPGGHDGMLRAASATNSSYRTHFEIYP